MIFSIWLLSFIFTPSIADVPLNLPEFVPFRESHLIATLTNRNTNHVTYMEEYSSSKDNRKGKIEVVRGSQSYTIFYDERDDFRVVMTDSDCQVFNYYNRKWNQKLPDISSELEKILIMLGPSIYFRIQASLINTPSGEAPIFWQDGGSAVVRGIQVDSKFAKIESDLNVTVYKQASNAYQDPNRIDFEGIFLGQSESFTIDHYLTEYLDDLSYDVAPTPGIGCAEYPTKNMPFPSKDIIGLTDIFHLSAVEYTYQSSESSESDVSQIDLELFVDASAKIVRYIVDYGDALLETIYDYNSGISFAFEQPRCTIAPMTVDDIGVVDGKFDAQELLWQRGSFKYLGKILFEQRNGVIAHVWEKIEYDASYEGTKYAKIVTTQYFADKIDISFPIPSNDHKILLGMTRKLYSLDVEKNYQLEETTRRDVYDFYETISESEYQTLFQFSDCDSKEKDKLWLIFELRPIDVDKIKEALKTAEQNLIMLRKGIRDLIVKSIPLSPLRINNIDFDFSQNSISAHVLFTEKPKLTDGLIRQNKQISRNSIKPYADEVKTLFDCVSKVAHYSKVSSIAWCKDPKTKNEQRCAPIMDVSTLIESQGEDSIACEIYSHPVGNLRDLVDETDLSTLHDSLLARVTSKIFSVGPTDNKARLFDFIISNIIYSDVSKDVKSSKLLFDQLFSSYKLNSNNPLVYTPDQSIKTLGDCYYICETSEAIDCTSFSFCINPKDQSKVSCQLTSQMLLVGGDEKVRDAIEADDHCTVYSKNHIFDFVKIKGRQLLHSGVKELVITAEQCAAKCAASANCKSFDYCDKVCALSDDIYLDRLSSPDAKCDSYTLKKTENFKITGNHLVDEVMFVETGVNLDQCASLCFDYVSGDDKCHSFNYCPKNRAQSTCQLSQKTISKMIQDPAPRSAINCFNYELVERKSDDVKAEASTVTSAGGSILAIVLVVCLAVGLVYGFVGEYIYLKVNNKLRTNNATAAQSQTITWSRQVDESTHSNNN
ncbi:uncharacterized protein LOC107363529 [Tetranychus urticae]|uniref:Apple domain-containing protein n=1 Tax=Tetranychus urticae TaxID=32264 RepID=T1KEM9_TETUR|nr:uncharacterized protein LOC107363529 [Tetranychus urticae]